MSYFSNTEDQSLGASFGCGSECNCGPCKSGMSGLDEWYEKEEADEPSQPAPPKAPSPMQPPAGAAPQAGSLKGWDRPAIGMGYYGVPRAAAQLHGFAQPRGPLPRPVIPRTPLGQMPTNPMVPKPWCSELSKIQSNTCFPYAASEIATSKTEAGHLSPDVVLVQPGPAPMNRILSCRYLIIRDFGIDWRHLKLATRNEQLLKDWLNRFETDKSLTFRIVGYSDCAGVERNNFLLRLGRARNVFKLFGSSARSRVMAVIAAPQETYLTENSTVASRAHNRAVVIEMFLNSFQTI
jgi:hypothetical protein